MSSIAPVSAQTPRVSTVKEARPAPQEAPAAVPQAAADQLAVSPGLAKERLASWTDGAHARLKKPDTQEARSVLAESGEWLKRKDLKPEDRAELLLVTSRAYGALASLKVDRVANGKKAFADLQQAVKLAPAKQDVVESYGRTIVALVNLDFISRSFVQGSLGIDLAVEAKRAGDLLKPFSRDPLAQLMRKGLAEHADDDAAGAEAETLLKAMDPKAVARARKELAGDAELASE